jgi:hypothetical protein
MKNFYRIALLVLCTVHFFQIPDAAAARVIATASYGLPPPPGGLSFDDSQRVTEATPAIADAQVNTFVNYTPLGTTIGALALSSASATDLKARASLAITAFDPDIVGEGFYVNASARMDDTYTLSGLIDVYASPVFHLDGELFSDTSYLTSRVHFYSNQFGTLFEQNGTPIPTPVDQPIIGDATLFSGSRFFDFTLYASVERNDTDIPAGDYTAYADFSSTVSLLGFALFEDAAMSKPIVDGVTVTGSDGQAIQVLDLTTLNAVPVPAAVWLFCSAVVGLIGLGRRRA